MGGFISCAGRIESKWLKHNFERVYYIHNVEMDDVKEII